MTAFNVVRLRVKPGRDKEFMDLFKDADHGFAGMRRVCVIGTGEGSYCIVGEWNSFDNIVSARSGMGEILNAFRNCLEDLGGDKGMTDPVSGIAVLERDGPAKANLKRKVKRAKPSKKKKPAKKSAKKPTRKRSTKRKKRK